MACLFLTDVSSGHWRCSGAAGFPGGPSECESLVVWPEIFAIIWRLGYGF